MLTGLEYWLLLGALDVIIGTVMFLALVGRMSRSAAFRRVGIVVLVIAAGIVVWGIGIESVREALVGTAVTVLFVGTFAILATDNWGDFWSWWIEDED